MPEFEKPPKTATQLLVEGCLLLILFAIIVAVLLAIVISVFNRWWYGK